MLSKLFEALASCVIAILPTSLLLRWKMRDLVEATEQES